MTQKNFEEGHLRSNQLDDLIRRDAKQELSSEELLNISEDDAEAILAARNARKAARNHGAF